MKLVTLSHSFYKKYENCKEILRKSNRPYLYISVKIDNKTFAIPLRHHINHPYSFITIENYGLDFTKAVLIEKSDISSDNPRIDTKEWKIIKKNLDKIIYKFKKYIKKYKKAKQENNPRYSNIIAYSSLQYFNI